MTPPHLKSPSSSRVTVAVIGLGMGATHAEAYQQVPEAQLVAVSDLDPQRLARWAPTVGADQCYEDYRRMLRTVNPDLVSVAVPNHLHAQVTIDCLRAGAHVLCEKPMATNLAQATAMRDEAQKAGRKLGINFSYRFTPAARALKDLAEDGFLGRPYHASTRWTRRDGFPGFGSWFSRKSLSGGGPLIDLGVHRIDLAMWLMGSPNPISVSGSTHCCLGAARAQAEGKTCDVEDFATGFIRFDNGASLLVEASWAGFQEPPEWMSTTVMGSRGTLVHRNNGGWYQFVGEYYTSHKGHPLAGRILDTGATVPSSYAEMVRSILHDTSPPAGADDGVRLQQVLDALYASAAAGHEIPLDRRPA